MSEHDDHKKQPDRTFVPAERWVFPARRRTRNEPDEREPDEKAPSAKPIRTFLDDEPGRVSRTEQAEGRGRIVVQAGLGLCVSFVLAACGRHDNRPQHVGPPLGDTHVSQAPADPTVPPPDAPDWEQPSPGLPIQAPIGNAPVQPAPGQPQVPAQAPTSDQQQPGAFSPPPPSENQPDASQPEIPQPAPPSTTPQPQDQPQQQ